jgi:hypothetical protein
VDVDLLESSSHCLLPLLSRNLERLGVEAPILQRLKGTRRYTWSANLELIRGISPLLRDFQHAGIEMILLKDAALVTRYYGDYGFRPIRSLHVLVHPPDVPTAMTLLRECGWIPSARLPEKQIPSANRHTFFFHDTSGRQFTLHPRLFRPDRDPSTDDAFWIHSESIKLGTMDVLVPGPTEQLLDVCAFGLIWAVVPPVQWVADAMMILESPDSTIDWTRFTTMARQARVVLPARESLRYLRDRFGVNVPPDVLERLDAIPISNVERSEYRKRTRRPRLLHRLRWRASLQRQQA